MSLVPGIKIYAAEEAGKKARVGDWCKDVYRQLHLDSHFADFNKVFTRFDAEAAARMYEESGAQMVSFFAKGWGGYSYYPTEIGVVHPGLGCDYTGELNAALKKRGIRTIIYFMLGTERYHQKNHPDWVYTKEIEWDLTDNTENKVAIMCFNSPYVDEVGIPQMKEIISRYDPDGFFVDIVMHQYMLWNCYCPNCKRLYAEEVGGEIPTDDADPRAFIYRKWLNRRMEAHMEKCYRELATLKPDIAIINNFSWFMRYPVTPPYYVPHVTWDTPPPDVGLYSWNFSLEARYLSTMPGVPWSVMNTRGNNWSEYSLREKEAFLQECALVHAAGGSNYLSDIPYPSGNPDTAVYEVFGAVNERTKALEPYLKSCRPVADTAVLHSADSVWSKAPITPIDGWPYGPPYHSVCGAHKALIEGHVQMGILNSQIFDTTINEYGALVLPDQQILSGKEISTIKNFVRNGGALIASYETGIRDTENNKLTNFALSDVLGIRYRDSVETSVSYLKGTPDLKSSGIPAMDIQVNGPYTRIEATTAKTILPLVPPFQGIKTGTPPPAELPIGPGVTINNYGKGRALYFAPEIFGGYFRADTPVMRKLILWALGLVYPGESRRIELDDAPVNVELFYNHRRGERLIHLVNYSGDKRDIGTPQVQDIPTVYGIKVRARLEKEPSSVQLVPDRKTIEFEYSDNWLQFEAGPLKIHNVYRVML